MRGFFDVYAGYLMAVCARYLDDDEDAKDVLQETLISIFTDIDKFEYRGEGSLRAWATRIATFKALKFIREKKKADISALDHDLAVRDVEEDELDVRQIPQDVIHAMIRQLPTRYRVVFNLYVFEDKSHKEIAELLGVQESSSASLLHRAKKLLAEKLTEYRNNPQER